MDASTRLHTGAHSPPGSVGATAAAMLAAATIVAILSLDGALGFSWAASLIAALLISVSGQWLRGATAAFDLPPRSLSRWLLLATPTATALLAAAAFAGPHATGLGAMFYVAICGASEVAWAIKHWSRPAPTPALANSTAGVSWLLRDDIENEDASSALHVVGAASANLLVEGESEEEDFLPAGVIQHLTRANTEEGEAIYGGARASFAVGERSQTIHVAFCPPFSARPELTATPISGPAANIKCAEVQSFGARVEIRLNTAPTEEVEIGIEYYALLAKEGKEADNNQHL